MTVQYTADLEQIEAQVARAEQYAELVQVTVARLESVVDALQLTWTGRAAEAHRVAHREWACGMHEMGAALGMLRACARQAHDEYLAAAEANHAMWSALA